MDILFYLREYLQSHKTTSIEGLGTFYKEKSPGKYDVDKHAFIPPSYILTFNTDINSPENFVNFIADTSTINTNAAKTRIDQFVAQIHAQLKDQQEFTLTGLGKFNLVNNEIVFSADKESSFGNEFYGLPNLTEIKQATEQKVEVPEVENNVSEPKESETPISKDEIERTRLDNEKKFTGKPFTPNYDYDDVSDDQMSKPVKILLRSLLVVAIIAAVLALAYFFKPQLFDKTINNSEPIIAEPAIPNDTLALEDSLINNPDTSLLANLDSTVVIKEQPKPIENSVTTYEVIGSAERNQKRIDLVINTMKKRGIEAKALENVPGKLVKISLGSFTDFKLAKKHQDSLRKKLNNPEIYIQTINPKK